MLRVSISLYYRCSVETRCFASLFRVYTIQIHYPETRGIGDARHRRREASETRSIASLLSRYPETRGIASLFRVYTIQIHYPETRGIGDAKHRRREASRLYYPAIQRREASRLYFASILSRYTIQRREASETRGIASLFRVYTIQIHYPETRGIGDARHRVSTIQRREASRLYYSLYSSFPLSPFSYEIC